MQAEIERRRGDTYADSITLTNAATDEIVNLTGCTFKLTVDTLRNPPDESTQVYQLVGVCLLPATGEVTFAPTESQADLVGVFYYDIEMIDADGYKRTIESGTYTYIQDITK